MREREPAKAGFFVSGASFLKTRVYVDGYNLYFGALKPTQYKWLDPVKLVLNHIIPQSAPKKFAISDSNPFHATFFTSPVIPKLSFSADSKKDQDSYHQALLSQYTEEQFDIVLGYHTPNRVFRRKVDENNPNELHPDCEQVEVWRIEEKQTDVNIAVHAMRDAYTDPELEHLIFVSNDTDLCGLLEHLKSMNKFTVGVIAPSFDESRRASADLVEIADWTRHTLKSDELRASQLPLHITESVRTSKKLKYPLRKPMAWFGSRDTAVAVFDTLYSAYKKRNSCYKWLEQNPIPQNNPDLPDLPSPAIELLNDTESADLVLRHAEAFAEYVRSKNNR